jgi:hypothetical protein
VASDNFNLFFALIAGVVCVVLALKFLLDKDFAMSYIQKSPKAFLWRKFLGVDKTYTLTRTVCAPFTLIMGIALIVTGIIGILRLR